MTLCASNPVNLAWVNGGVQVKNVVCFVLAMLLVVCAMPLPAGADMTVYIAGAAVEVPAALQLLMLGFALLSVGRLVRKWRQSGRDAGHDHSS
jgi:uncharacterized protein YhhL (DUF1145 family)